MDAHAQLLDAATRLFAAHGVDATSLSAIAEAVGVRKASLLYHFSSKEALHQAVIDRVLSHFRQVLPRLLEVAAAESRFDALIEEAVAFFEEDPDRARLVLRESLDRPDAMRERLTSSVRPWLTILARSIDEGRDRGHLRADVDPEAYLVQVVHLVVAGVATADTMGVLLEGSSEAKARWRRELFRVARTSLFTDRGLSQLDARRVAS